MEKSEWYKFSAIFKDVLNLDLKPVAVSCLKKDILKTQTPKVRICKAIIDAAKGDTFQICKDNNLCFGASWHLGF